MTGTPENILELPLVTTLDGTEYFETVVAGASVRVAASVIAGTAPALTVAQSASTSYTFVLGDAQTYKQFTSASAVSAIIPANASVAFVVGTIILLEQYGAGTVTLSGAVGVTLNSNGGKVVSNGQFAVFSILKVATNTWTLSGNLT